MSFEKKVLVLKQVDGAFSLNGKTASGIFRLETDCGTSTLYLSVVNLVSAETSEYMLGVLDSNEKLSVFPLGSRPTSFRQTLISPIPFSSGISAGVYSVKDFLPSLILFSADGLGYESQKRFRSALCDKCLADKKSAEKEILKAYDDEAVASENYYELDESIDKKIKTLSGREDELLRFENFDDGSANEKEKEKERIYVSGFQDEKFASESVEYSARNPYYEKAKPELDKLFSSFEPYDKLLSIFPDGKWVKINYSQSGYYVVGVINENKTPKYICYGVPAVYSKTPPKELDGFCTFIPLSIFSLDGDGFWMMFQDAVTGECIKKS